MPLSEADTRAKLIDPAIHARGWTEDLICREETAGAIEIISGRPYKRLHGRTDYTLRIRVSPTAQALAVALIEAKAESLPPTHGLEQAKLYASSKRLNVPFVFTSNGHLFVEYDRISGITSVPKPMGKFPSPDDLRSRYEQHVGFRLGDEAAKPLLVRYTGGEATRRYYQDAAIRAVLEKLARGEKRALLSLATGAGKTFIAVHLLKKIADAGQLRRALFICDRDELRTQGLLAFQGVFGNDAAEVTGGNPQKNARILIATYQTLHVDREDADASFLTENYPPDYFSHIVIDECHRSAWGKWSEVLKRNPQAVQIGLTATPRQIEVTERSREALADQQISADNLRHFGEPAYEYDMAQGIEDGYLAGCEIVKRDIFLDGQADNERQTGVERADLEDKDLYDARTGERLSVAELHDRYEAPSFEDTLLLPDRVKVMARDFFAHLVETGGPEQKSIIFCARDEHADRVAVELNNLYADWCASNGRRRLDPYAFKCTAASGGALFVSALKGNNRNHFVATTVELLTTGVDVPSVRNIVFFKYVRSPIAFYQMIGRGTRLDPATGKLMFRVYDYTDATRLFGEEFKSKFRPPAKEGSEPPTPPSEETAIVAEGFTVKTGPAGKYIVTMVDGKAVPVTAEEYKQRLTARLIAEAATVEQFREHWITPPDRKTMLERLPDGARSAYLVRALDGMDDYDLFDVLAALAYGQAPRTRSERAAAFNYKNVTWLAALPQETAKAIEALAAQFARAGTDGLESRHIFQTAEVQQAGGLQALSKGGAPAEVLRQTKERMFAA